MSLQPPHAELPLFQPVQQSTMLDIRESLPWRDWESGVAEATRRQALLYVFAEHAWSNAAQRTSLMIDGDLELRQTLGETVVPVFVDPDERPDLVANWRVASLRQVGSVGPPMSFLASPEGDPFIFFPSLWVEGKDPYPSLAGILGAGIDALRDEPDGMRAESAGNRIAPGDVNTESATDGPLTVHGELLDHALGGLVEDPKHPRPALVWAMLARKAASGLEEAQDAWLGNTLQRMERGGICDQIDRGFHRCARDSRWVVPHFEKPIPLNAQLAAVYARAAREYHDLTLKSVAKELAAFVAQAFESGIDLVASDTEYYTWSSEEIRQAVDMSHLQAVSLHFNVVPGLFRQSLHQALQPDRMGAYSHGSPESLSVSIALGRGQLLRTRQKRPSPEVRSSPALSWRATTVRWLLECAMLGIDVDTGMVTNGLEAHLAERFDPDVGYRREGGAAWLEDQAAILDAFVAAARVAEHDANPWIERAIALSDVLTSHYRHGDYWTDRPVTAAPTAPSVALVDDVIPGTIGTLHTALLDLAARTQSGDLHSIGEASRAAYNGFIQEMGPFAASSWHRC